MNQNFTVLVTGANRGIGLEFVRQYANAGWNVLACCRDLDRAVELKVLASNAPNIRLNSLDVSNFNQIENLALSLKMESIDLLINNAGLYPHSSFGDTNHHDWLRSFEVNTMGPVKMAECFYGNVASSRLKKIVSISSKMGSIEDNTSGGSYIYRTSKAALNIAMKSLSIDLRAYGIITCTLHPGWVMTEMGGPNALITKEMSVSGLRKVIESLTIKDSGNFIGFDGKRIPW